MTPRNESNYDLLADLEANIAHTAWIEAHIDDWTGPLRGIATDTDRVQGTGADVKLTPTEAAATADNDTTQLAISAQMQIDDLARLRVIANRMNARRNGTLNRTTLDQARTSVDEHTTPSTVGWCVACDRHCDGTRNSTQLVNQLCNTCRQGELRAWQQSGYNPADRQLHRDQWIKGEQTRRREHHAS